MFSYDIEKKQAFSSSSIKSSEQQSSKTIESPLIGIEKVKINSEAKVKLTQKGFVWREQFENTLTVALIETNFESMGVKLQYGNFELMVSVIFINLEEKIFENFHSQAGAFGVVRFCHFEDQQYAIKSIKIKEQNNEIDLESIYKEYFLCCMVDALEVGPQMHRLFGYDIVVSKSTAFFSMERCFNFIEEPATMQAKLLEILHVLHQVRFIHLDIKPQNISYSKQLGKIVFIDFGLSKIIKQPKGEKTKTRFSGTLSYCSQEMRNCCILNKPMLVDLYENDYCCLRKSIKQIQSEKEQQKITYSEVGAGQQLNQINFFQELALLIRLKFFIERQDCQQVLKILETPHTIYKSIYQIFINFTLPKGISENVQIQNKVRLLRNKIFSLNQEFFPLDNILCTFFSQGSQQISAQKIVPISQLLQLEKMSFQTILAKVQMVYKLFLFFDPFSKKNAKTLTNVNLKEAVVLKIYQMIHPNSILPTFFCQKLRQTLIFFYDNLKKLKNLKVLLSLRLLFVSIQDWSYVEEIEDQILQCIEKPLLKILKIMQFSIFWDLLLQDFDHKRKSKWKTMIENTKRQQCNSYSKKLDDVELLMAQNKRFFHQKKLKESTLRSLVEFYHQINQGDEKQALYAITYIYCELSKIHYSLFTCPPKGLTIKIYSQFFLLFKVESEKAEELEHKMLLSLWFQIDGNISKQLAQRAINHKFLILRESKQCINCLFVVLLKSAFIYKECLYFFLEKIETLTQSTIEYLTDYSLFTHLVLLQFCFIFIRFNKERPVVAQRINKTEECQLLHKIQEIFMNILNKEGLKKILQKSKQVKLKMMILEAQIFFRKQKSEKEKKLVLQAIVLQLQPLPYHCPNFVVYFFHLFSSFQSNLLSKQNHFSKDILIQVVSTYIEQKQFYIFEKVMIVLGFYIKIKNQRGQSNTHQIILMFISHFSAGNQFFAENPHNKTLFYAIEAFRRSLAPQKILQIYNKIKSNKLQFTEGLYGFYVLKLFILIQDQLGSEDRRRQIIRTALCLSKMPWICQKDAKPILLCLCRLNNMYASKRKLFNCYKLEGKLSGSEKFNELKHKIAKKFRQSTLKALEQIYTKLKKYNSDTQSKILSLNLSVNHIFE